MGRRIGPGIGQVAPAGAGGGGLAGERHMALLRSLAVSAAVGAGVGAVVVGPITVAFALTALAVILAVDRLTPRHRRAAPRVSVPLVAVVLVALAVLAAVRVAVALDQARVV